jgi:hypothetical protein
MVGVIGFTPHILCSALRAALKRMPKRSRRFGEPTRPLRALVVGKSTLCLFFGNWLGKQNNGRCDRIYSAHPVLRPSGRAEAHAKTFQTFW